MGGPRNGGGGGRKRKRTFEKRFRRTKRRYTEGLEQRDVDQIQDEIIKIKRGTYKDEKPDIDKPGQAQFKCIICARYFINKNVLTLHKKTKKHKKMLKKVSQPQYTQKEADKCGGLGREETVKNGAHQIGQRPFQRQSNVQLMTMDQ
mmetsp:Transcript_70945/g.112749  ORF Transcript_70945/g.112749 Transcript_70945/m.112749 type:complete len:147 (-) Transcript_70945:245-685(-)|eukprot:CAMPEP_0197041272 /NCGR_PEP_ID=MMETSP1384-20130603/17835_1 /TAXON_ID=29189 /ORGANISM="Ammonia sp." /LENGTH=146 /DNA_ID=CAMNT_0042472157 /DNA_START=55 /DNA_END=495 /DNA_ORIENTATION=-